MEGWGGVSLQQLDDRLLPEHNRVIERRLTVLVHCLDIGPSCEQLLNDSLVASSSRT